MHGIRRPNTRQNVIALATGFVAFVLVLVFETGLNLKYKTMFEFPADFRELYYSASLVGRDWSNVTSLPYFSVTPALFYALIFKFVNRGPLFLWQTFLLVGTICKSVPALVSGYISNKYLEIKPIYSIGIGLVCSLCYPGRSNVLSLHSFAVLFIWAIIALVFEYENSYKQSIRYIMVALMTISTVFLSMTSILYCIVFIALFALLVIDYRIGVLKKTNLLISSIIVFLGIVIFSLLIWWFEGLLIPENTNLFNVRGTLQNEILKLTYEIDSLNRVDGWLGLFDAIFGSIWELTIYSFGIIPIVCFYAINQLSQSIRLKEKKISGVYVIVLVSLILTIVYRSLTIGYNFATMHRKHYSPFTGIFEIYNYVSFIGPLFFVFLAMMLYKTKISKKVICLSLISFVCSSVYIYFSVFFPTKNINGYSINNCFGTNDFIPLSLFSSQDIIGIAIAFILLITLIILSSISITDILDFKETTLLLAGLFVFNYLYGYYSMDHGYWENVSYFSIINASFGLKENLGDDFDSIEPIYYVGEDVGGYLLQYALKNSTVIPSVPDVDDSNIFIISSHGVVESAAYFDVTDYYYCKGMDTETNEFFFVKGHDYMDLLASYGYSLSSCAKEYYEYQNLNRIYKIALGRNIDAKGLEYWSEEISEGNVTYKEFIYGVLMGEEFMSKGYSHRDIVNKFYTLFYDPDLTDDEKYEPKYEDLKMLSKQLDEGVPFNLFIEGFFISENCVLDDLRWE